jgi:hypothetical protein
VEALIKASPEVIHGVFGIIHNYKVAGPWRRFQNQFSDTIQYTWCRIDSKLGGPAVRVGETGWSFKGQHYAAHGTDQAMLAADQHMFQHEWILVPGFESQS